MRYSKYSTVTHLLKVAADQTAIRFLSPVYLVGSFISNKKHALDIDIVLVLTEDRFHRLFNRDGRILNDRVFNFRKKQKLYFEKIIKYYDIDFKVQRIWEFEEIKKKKLKLDSIMKFPI